ncbi:glycosyltransferase [Pseudomonas promysalinigenes]|uniref:glycosyltransferase n=1 Tax=Pseudomonas promysalinigenes TaxID=485898 RepID=UPI00391712DC
MVRSLFAKRPSPYYIMAPDYRRSSAGIRVLHMLCDALMRAGQEAYIAAKGMHPGLMTPLLTDTVVALHKAQGVEPIVVYPEVVDGNPFKGNVVVRYLLNRPGFLNNVRPYADTDVLFSYTRELLQPGMEEDRVLYMPAVDLSIFCPPSDSHSRIPGKVCYYRGRKSQVEIDPALLGDDAVEITGQSPGSWEELAALFQSCEYFYCTEPSGLAAEAALCGCVAVILPNAYAPKPISHHENNCYGVAWGNSEESLQQARASMPLLRESLLQHQRTFWSALDHFIVVTQEAVEQYRIRSQVSEAQRWLEQRKLDDVQRTQVAQYLQARPTLRLGLVVLDQQGDTLALNRTLGSLAAFAEPNIALVPMVVGGVQNVAGAVNACLVDADCELFMLLEAGETLTASGLLSLMLERIAAPNSRAFYADEVMRDGNGMIELQLRPALNLDLLLSLPAAMACHWLFDRGIWQGLGGFDTRYPQAFELDYILRLIEAGGLEGLAHVSEPLVVGQPPVLQDQPEQREVIEAHLRRRGYPAAHVISRLPGRYELDYGHDVCPPVSILIALEGQLAYAQRCVQSLLEGTAYDNYEVLLLNRSDDDSATEQWLAGIEELAVGHLRVLRFDAEFDQQAVLNHAAAQSRGDFLLFLDPHVGVIDNGWLAQMLNHAMRPEVGGVAAKLLDGDGRVRQGGLLLGLSGPVTAPFDGLPGDAAGYMHRLEVDQNYSALGAQCLMVRRELFESVGGFDGQMMPWAHVDLCLKLQQAGYLNVWTPRAQLLVSDSEITSATVEQEDCLYARWLPVIARDPAGNPNLVHGERAGQFSYADPQLSWRPLAVQASLPTVIAHTDASLASQHRLTLPFNALYERGLIQGAVHGKWLDVPWLERFAPAAIILQGLTDPEHIQAMWRMKAFSKAFKVYDLGTYLPDARLQGPYARKSAEDMLALLRLGIESMDRLVVPTTFMAQVCEGFNTDIQVLEDRLAPEQWAGLQCQRRCDDKPRVGWVGAMSEQDDLELIAEAIKILADEVHWVVLGSCPEHLRPFMHEVHASVPAERYADKLASLNLDLAVVPLQQSLLNRCKSNLRLLEHGVCGVPVICSDIEAHHGDLPIKRVAGQAAAWVDAIRIHISDLEAVAQLGDYLRQCVLQGWMLDEPALVRWRNGWLGSSPA